MNIIKGDLIHLALLGEFDVIIHGANCQCTMRSGIAKSIREKFPEVYEVDTKTIKGSREKLGTISFVKINNSSLVVVNAYTQFNYGRSGNQYVDYEAIRSAMKAIKLAFPDKKIGYPKIGAGLGGGDWEIISKIINEELKGENHTLVEYENF